MDDHQAIELTPEMKIFMDKQNMNTLEDLLAIEPEDLLQLEGFGWRLMKQVLELREAE